MSDDNGAGARFTPDQLNALKDRNPVHEIAGHAVTLRKRGRRGYIGPCPMCSDDPQSRTATRFECDASKWVCAVCQRGGDVIALVCQREGLGFTAAVERLGGVRDEVPTPAMADRRGSQDYAAGKLADANPYSDAVLSRSWLRGWCKGERRAKYEAFARGRERDRLFGFWNAGTHWRGTILADYFAGRGLLRPSNAQLRFHPDMPLFCDGREVEPILAHRGPAMLAAIYDAAGGFSGLHTTWLDPNGPKGKAAVAHPNTGELLPSKKVRGTKAGGYIDLGGCAPDLAARMIAGEGIETVLAVFTALMRAGRDMRGTSLRAAVDLGNLAGRADGTVAHPTLKTEGGRPQRVPGVEPDLNSPAMPVPDAIAELVLLGDGDSDPFLTRHAMERARRRHERAGRAVRVRFAPAGVDFDDMMQGQKNDR